MPQAYLRDFAADANRSKIWRFSKTSGDPELKPIDKVAVRHHLYVPIDRATEKRDDSFERQLSELEMWLGHPVWRQLLTESIDLGWEPLRKIVSLMVAVMYLRTPLHYERARAVHEQMVKTIGGHKQLPTGFEWRGVEYELDPASWPSYRDATEDDLKTLWIDQMKDATSYAEILLGMRWSMLIAAQPTFITSDNPVVVTHPSLDFRGLTNRETRIMFPLSPNRILCMDHWHNEPADNYYQLIGMGAAQNTLIWRNAIEHMFCHQDPDEVLKTIVAEAEKFGDF